MLHLCIFAIENDFVSYFEHEENPRIFTLQFSNLANFRVHAKLIELQNKPEVLGVCMLSR